MGATVLGRTLEMASYIRGVAAICLLSLALFGQAQAAQQYLAQGPIFKPGNEVFIYAPDYPSLCAAIAATWEPFHASTGWVSPSLTSTLTVTVTAPPNTTTAPYSYCNASGQYFTVDTSGYEYGPFPTNFSVEMTALACGGSGQTACASPPQKAAGPSCPAGCSSGSTSGDSGAADAGSGGTVKGNAVDVANDNAYQAETDYLGAGADPIRFVRSFSSLTAYAGQPLLGEMGWSASYFQYLLPEGTALVMAHRPDGRILVFRNSGSGVYASDADVADQLSQTSSGWQYHTADDTIETYNANGLLLSVATRGGATVTLTYASGATSLGSPPQSLADSFGHSLTFTYQNDATGAQRLSSITDPSGKTISYSYDTVGRPVKVTYADGSTRGYGYGTTTSAIQWLLLSVTDEANVQYASWTYATAGTQLLSSQLAGGVAQYSFSSSLSGSGGSVTVTDPLGQSRTYNQSLILGRYRTTSSSAACPGCGEDASRTYDANGNITARTDFNGNETQYTYDTTRNLETSRTEAYGTSAARTINTAWDPNWRQPDTVTEPNRTTAYTYDSMGNTLTKTITDTTVTPNLSRTWTYTYDSYGRMLTAQGPRTDVNSTTTYTYYTCTTGYQCGELETVTDPVGNVTTYNTYNAHGQPLTITDPNGVVTTLTYDNRMRLTSRTVGTETTSFSYYPTGLLETVTLPDSSSITYTYDAAHRLTQITDSAGNSIQYTLDAMGNRAAENSYDPSMALHRTHTRVYNALNELYQDINAAGTSAVSTTYSYDNNANQTGIAAPLSRNTADAYDQLNRLNQIIDPASGVTSFGYDAEDDLTSVKDPRNLTTSYSYNGFGDATQLVSPDTGTSTGTYDSSGNLSVATDARGATATYTYDAANRVTQILYQNSSGVTDQTFVFGYDAGTYGKGRLISAGDGNETLSWSYDPQGRVVGKGITVGMQVESVGYAYTHADLTAMTTPSGQDIAYSYNSNHQITGISVNGTPILTDVTYEPFGGVNGWTWGDGSTVSRTYNEDGLISQIVTAGVTLGYSYDDANRITGISDSSNSALTWAYEYDLLDRLTSASTSANTYGWTYDANGNRLTQTGTNPSTFDVSMTSNQLADTTGSLARTYTYDAAGHTTGYGSLTFSYNDRGRMEGTSGSSTSYLYNALGQMVQKSGSAGTTILVYDEAGHLISESDGSGNLIEETVYLGDIPVATLRPNGSGGINIFYIHTDHLNMPRKISQPTTGTLAWRWDSDPFGTTAPNQNPGGLGTFVYNERLPGQYYMAETGLNQNVNRDYDPLAGGYVESDPIGLAGGSYSPYVYGLNNPVANIDPSGLDPSQCNDDDECERQVLADEDVCRSLKDPGARARCWQSANERYGACRAKRPIPPLVVSRDAAPTPTPVPPLVPVLPTVPAPSAPPIVAPEPVPVVPPITDPLPILP